MNVAAKCSLVNEQKYWLRFNSPETLSICDSRQSPKESQGGAVAPIALLRAPLMPMTDIQELLGSPRGCKKAQPNEVKLPALRLIQTLLLQVECKKVQPNKVKLLALHLIQTLLLQVKCKKAQPKEVKLLALHLIQTRLLQVECKKAQPKEVECKKVQPKEVKLAALQLIQALLLQGEGKKAIPIEVISALQLILALLLQVECKKAQPKEVMLPANLAKTRAAGRGAYGELLMLNPATAAGFTAASNVAASAAAYRYTPYPLPATAAHHPVGGGLAGFLPMATAAAQTAPNPLQYAPAPALYGVAGAVHAAASCKRAFASAVAAMRPPPHHHHPPTLSYSMSDLLGIQGLDMSAMYHPAALHILCGRWEHYLMKS
ncbi:unnamed protein product [Timema podura]|uniref:Uncharacterized protein n=1 Tax=Timema podura TaxID=61482 RepID=A0ABN7NEB3_TIMPD|nr:unnamed protein product [Timema podura]